MTFDAIEALRTLKMACLCLIGTQFAALITCMRADFGVNSR